MSMPMIDTRRLRRLPWIHLLGAVLVGVTAWLHATGSAEAGSGTIRLGRLAFTAVNMATGEPFDSAPLFPRAVLVPDRPVEASVRVRNSGEVPLSLRLRAVPEGGGDGPATAPESGGSLHVQVRRGDGKTLFSGPLLALNVEEVEHLDVREEGVLHLSVWLPADNVATSMGTSTSVGFILDAEQRP